jgi:L-threonylcarbamoyladenylate synthase
MCGPCGDRWLPGRPLLSDWLQPFGRVRSLSHPVSQLLAAGVGGVLIATSANLSGQPPCRRLEDLEIDVISQVDAIIDGGDTAGQAPSTVVDVTAVPAQLLREGAIPWQAISQFLCG